MEIWKDSPIYPEQYMVSNVGRVKNKITNHILKVNKDEWGYSYYVLSVKRNIRTIRTHRLVAGAFLSNPDNKPTVDHINGIKEDNRVENLRWATHKEQMQNPNTLEKLRGHRKSYKRLKKVSHNFPFWKFSIAKRKKKVVVIYDDGSCKKYNSLTELCENENMRMNRVSEIIHGKRKQSMGKTIILEPKA
jgi:hypothetical protein